MLLEFSNQIKLTDESLLTLFCEVENIMNCRPLNAVTNDISDLEAITPNHLLKLNAQIDFPPGIFNPNDLYVNRRWRQTQYIANQFWFRWRREYLNLLMQRQKWFTPQRVHKVGDLVLVTDQLLPRNMWCIGRVIAVNIHDNHVRSVTIKVSKCKHGRNLDFSTTTLERPINKIILLAPSEKL